MPRVTVSTADVQKAVRLNVKAAIGIDGLSGDGKTGLALEIAHVLEDDWSKISDVDTENRSLSLYIGKTLQSGATVPEGKIEHAVMSKETGYSPFNYEFFRDDAIAKGCTVAIQDSFSHAWFRKDGVLDTVSKINEELAKKFGKGNKFNAWADDEVVDGKNLIFDLIRDSRIHVISTLRIKDDYAMITDGNGKNTVQNVGLKQITQDGLQYEFDLLLRVVKPASSSQNTPAKVEVLKSRYDIFEKGEIYDFDNATLLALKEYLEKGTSAAELDEKLRLELAAGLKEQANNNPTLKAYFKNTYPERKMDSLTLKELRDVNSVFLELTSGGK